MSLQQWLRNSWLRKIERSALEIANSLAIAEREISDGSLEGISPDGRFEHAYNAIRALCEVALHAEGFVVPKGQRPHERVIESLKFTLGEGYSDDVDFFDRSRRRRHQTTYDQPGTIQQRDADELLDAAKKLDTNVRSWLERNHPDLL